MGLSNDDCVKLPDGRIGRVRARASGQMTNPEFFCTTIIPTIARQTLDKTVESVLSRLISAAGIMLLAGARLLAPAFWRALTRTHLTAGFDPARRAAEPA
jgi:hypothetical protein